MPKLQMDTVMQVAIVVEDLKEGLRNFTNILGYEEGSLTSSKSIDNINEGKLQDAAYYGDIRPFHYVQHNFYMGGMDIEMFAPEPGYEDEKNPFTDFLKENGGPGIHHINVRLRNREEGIRWIKANIEGQDPPLYDLIFNGRNCTYFDLRKELGLTVEYGQRIVGPRASMSEEELEKLNAYRD